MTPTPHDTLHIQVAYFDGMEEGDVGYPYYVASCVEITATTDGRTWAELMHNISDMLAAYFEDEDTISFYNLVPNPHLAIMGVN